MRESLKHTHGKHSSGQPGFCMKKHAHRWKHSLILQLGPSMQGDGTWVRCNKMAALDLLQSPDVLGLEEIINRSRPVRARKKIYHHTYDH